MNLQNLPNPYDFANPVQDKDLLIGRDKELAEVRYYLEQALKTNRPFNIALIGDRASGKTSFLNIAQTEAQSRQLPCVRVDLDEGDAESQLAFFHKVLNSMLFRIFELGFFNGLSGRTYDTYLDIISTYEIPKTMDFCPFFFPIQYAKAKSAGRENVAVDDQLIKRDLERVFAEVRKPIVLLFDEGNVLKTSRILLEKLRNIFMNMPGYMIFISGTKDLFPLIDDVFSLIIRQFKKLEVGPFKRSVDTLKLIRRPLERMGIPKPTMRRLLDSEVGREIHTLSNGRPYEVQLICHMLFKRCQTGQAKKFLLSLPVLEEVRAELASGQDFVGREIIAAAKRFNRDALASMHVLCGSAEDVTFEDLWNVEYIVRGEGRWTRDRLRRQLDVLKDQGIVRETNSGYVQFLGDEFDRIYLKYIARQKGVTLSSWNLPSEFLLWDKLTEPLRRWKQLRSILVAPKEATTDNDLQLVYEAVKSGHVDENLSSSSIMAEEFLQMLLEKPNSPSIQIIELTGLNASGGLRSYLHWDDQDSGALTKLLRELESMKERAERVNWEFEIRRHEFQRLDRRTIVDGIRESSNGILRARMAEWFSSAIVESYIEKRDRIEAEFAADMHIALSDNPDTDSMNNIGYLCLSKGDDNAAEKLFRRVLESNELEKDTILPTYNLATVKVRKGAIQEAIALFQRIANGETRGEDSAGCLFVVKTWSASEGALLEETFEVQSVKGLAEAALTVLQNR